MMKQNCEACAIKAKTVTIKGRSLAWEKDWHENPEDPGMGRARTSTWKDQEDDWLV